VTDFQDPGWISADAWWVFVPYLGLWFAHRRGSKQPALIDVRWVFEAWLVTLTFTMVEAFTMTLKGTDEPSAAVVVAGLSAICLAGIAHYRGRPLSLRESSPAALAGSFRTVFYVSLGLATAPLLYGVCGVFVAASRVPLSVGMVFTIAAATLTAPTAASIRRQQSKLSEGGSTLSLGRAITAPSPSPDKGTR